MRRPWPALGRSATKKKCGKISGRNTCLYRENERTYCGVWKHITSAGSEHSCRTALLTGKYFYLASRFFFKIPYGDAELISELPRDWAALNFVVYMYCCWQTLAANGVQQVIITSVIIRTLFTENATWRRIERRWTLPAQLLHIYFMFLQPLSANGVLLS